MRRWLTLCLLATTLSTGCLKIAVGAPPPCPRWSDEAREQAREAIEGRAALELELARWAVYCEGIEEMR